MKKKYYLLVFAFIFIKSSFLYSQTITNVDCVNAINLIVNGPCAPSSNLDDFSQNNPLISGYLSAGESFKREG
ncbi:hypothetical protein, partial [Flavobacterium sp.]|uniref:hypothetical protein n=1 Tax=Flavobacterium sp. TaxID=239 RepID=UPI002C519426